MKPLTAHRIKKKEKKGYVAGFAFIISTLFALIIVIILVKVIFTNLDEGGMFADSDNAQDIANEFTGSVYPALDNMFFGSFIAGFLFLGVLAFQEPIRTNRAFFPVAILVVLPIMMLIATTLSNANDRFGTNATWASAEADSGFKAALIMDNLPVFVFGMMSLLLLIVYGLNKADGG